MSDIENETKLNLKKFHFRPLILYQLFGIKNNYSLIHTFISTLI